MASGFFALLDDIASLMDDVGAMTKIAGKKTAGILGDDLAVNAEKASGFVSSREIPVLWAITKGSLLNKLIILPIAFLLSAIFPVAITVILVLGGFYLAYEGAEKIYHFLVPQHKPHTEKVQINLSKDEILHLEQEKIKSAIITDFILSVEIVIIALGTVVEQPIWTQVMVVTIIALIATAGVYGIVAMIVRMDDLGLRLIDWNGKQHSLSDTIGRFLVGAMPVVVKSLSVIGTIALVLVAGGIFVHNLEFLHHWVAAMPAILGEFLTGLVVGFLCLLVVNTVKKMWLGFRPGAEDAGNDK
jgi:predicted DNA repair protein MutK